MTTQISRFRGHVSAAKSKLRLVELRKQLYCKIAAGEIIGELEEALDAEICTRWDELTGRCDADYVQKSCSIFPPRKPQRPPDPTESARRRRINSLRSSQPYALAVRHTEGKRSVAHTIACQHLIHGECVLPNDQIAALSGVCRSTVRNYRVDAVDRQEIEVIERPNSGGPNDTNIIRIKSKAWLDWLRKRQKSPRGIGFKGFNPLIPTKETELNTDSFAPVVKSGEAGFASHDPPVCRKVSSGAPS